MAVLPLEDVKILHGQHGQAPLPLII